jgi:hypothetical protein
MMLIQEVPETGIGCANWLDWTSEHYTTSLIFVEAKGAQQIKSTFGSPPQKALTSRVNKTIRWVL